ncbi:GMC oxidoreductase [Fusarium denticulatum]|uniref:GMC oxidoreductase n=1 Tax=Fusarium denticulatum TaxID=48507 RepID=A0A8H5XCX2_9HYPO|nr:GMC oxidoreductase [Fusarium denticulatum]
MLFGSFWLAVLALFFLPLAESLHVTPYIADEQLRNVYDYIIVGGGTAGLTIANRLSENPAVSVLVLEAGLLDDARNLSIPGGLLPVPGTIGSGGWQEYQWGLTTEPQNYLNNQNVGIPQGKAVGGSSILNGLCWSRGSVSDYDGWEKLGNKGWSWNDLLPYFKKSEKFTFNVEPHDANELQIRPQSAEHGYNGSVHVPYPQYFYDQSSNVLDGFAELGLSIIGDVNNGTAAGAMILPSSMHPDNQASKSAHNSSQRVMGVEFAPNNKSTARSISCTREVIVSAGAIFTPTLLQVSGIGPSDNLKSLDIPVKIDLPGIGYNLQDHPMVYANYYYRNESYFTSGEITDDVYDEVAEEYIRNRTVAFPSLRSATDDWKQFMNKSSGDGIPLNTPNSVKKGYELLKKPSLVAPSVPHHLRFFDLPKLDPRYCSDPIDCEIIVLGLQMDTKLIQTDAMKELMPEAESAFDTTDHETLMKHVMEKITTERHPSGTAAMMPLELGGVVDPELKVIPSAHLQASVYAIAEKAANMIKSAKPDCRIGELLPFPPRSRPTI